MIAKCFEVRDSATFIPVCAVSTESSNEGQRYLLRRAGYSLGHAVFLVNLNDSRANSDPHEWGGRTMPVAHLFIEEHFGELADGAVVDVEHILGETIRPKASEAQIQEPPKGNGADANPH